GKLLRADELIAGYRPAELNNGLVVLKEGQPVPEPHLQPSAVMSEARRMEWGDFVMLDARTGKPAVVTRDQIGGFLAATGIDPALEGRFEVTLADGSTVECRTVFDVTKQMLDQSYTPEHVSKLTWAPAEAIRQLAREVAA